MPKLRSLTTCTVNFTCVEKSWFRVRNTLSRAYRCNSRTLLRLNTQDMKKGLLLSIQTAILVITRTLCFKQSARTLERIPYTDHENKKNFNASKIHCIDLHRFTACNVKARPVQFGTHPTIIVQCLHCHFLWAIAQTAVLLLCLPWYTVVAQGISISFRYWTACVVVPAMWAATIHPHRGISTYVLLFCMVVAMVEIPSSTMYPAGSISKFSQQAKLLDSNQIMEVYWKHIVCYMYLISADSSLTRRRNAHLLMVQWNVIVTNMLWLS